MEESGTDPDMHLQSRSGNLYIALDKASFFNLRLLTFVLFLHENIFCW